MTSLNPVVIRLEYRGQPIELSDSHIRGFARKGSTFWVTVLLWNESELHLRITEALAVREVLCGEVSHVRRRLLAGVSSPFEKEAVCGYYSASQGPLAAFDFVDPEDRVSLTVITTPSGKIEVEERWPPP